MHLVMGKVQVLAMLLEVLVDLMVVQVVEAVVLDMLGRLTIVYIHHDYLVVVEEQTELSQLVMVVELST